jgi:hypothetical protein
MHLFFEFRQAHQSMEDEKNPSGFFEIQLVQKNQEEI